MQPASPYKETPANLVAVRAELARDEGLKAKPYRDTLGNWTWGVGHKVGSAAAAAHLLDIIKSSTPTFISSLIQSNLTTDIQVAINRLNAHLPWWSQQSPARRRALINLMFNMGWDNPETAAHEGLSGFANHTLVAFRCGFYEEAAHGFENSLWARQVGPGRCGRICTQIRQG